MSGTLSWVHLLSSQPLGHMRFSDPHVSVAEFIVWSIINAQLRWHIDLHWGRWGYVVDYPSTMCWCCWDSWQAKISIASHNWHPGNLILGYRIITSSIGPWNWSLRGLVPEIKFILFCTLLYVSVYMPNTRWLKVLPSFTSITGLWYIYMYIYDI